MTAHPHSAWVAQQLREAFPFDQAPRYLIRDRDGSYGDDFRRCLSSLGIEEVLIAPQSPWQNPFVERLIGTIRRDCLNHVIVFSAAHLRRIITRYLDYYHRARCHRSLERNSPVPRVLEQGGRIVAIPYLGGLHHRSGCSTPMGVFSRPASLDRCDPAFGEWPHDAARRAGSIDFFLRRRGTLASFSWMKLVAGAKETRNRSAAPGSAHVSGKKPWEVRP